MPSILVATGFVRIDSDTKPALKALKAFGAASATALSTTLLPATAAVTSGLLSVASAATAAAGAAAVYGAAVVPQFKAVTEANQKQEASENAKEKATVASGLAQQLAKKYGFEYGKQIAITSKMSADAKARAQEYNSALSSSKSAAKAATQAQSLYKQELAAMPPATRQTAEALQKLKDKSKEWSDSLSSSTMPIFTRGIEFLTGLLPKLTPIVKDVAQQLDVFANSLRMGLAGDVFKEFGRNVKENGAGALGTFLNVLRNLAVGFVGVLNAFMPMSAGMTGGLEKLTEKFAAWGATLGMSSGFGEFQKIAQDAGPKLINLFKALASAFVDIASAAGPLSGVGLQLLTVFAQLVDAIPTPVLRLLVPAILAVNIALKAYAIYQAAASAVTWLFTTAVTTSTGVTYASRSAMIAHRIATVASTIATAAWTAVTWLWTAATTAARVAMLAFRYALVAVRLAVVLTTTAFRLLAFAMISNPVGLVIAALVALGLAFYVLWKKSETFRNIVKGAWEGIKIAAKAVADWFMNTLVPFFRSVWDMIYKWYVKPLIYYWTVVVPAAAKFLWSMVVKYFTFMLNAVKTAWSLYKKLIIDPFLWFYTQAVPGAAKFLWSKVTGWWNRMTDGVRTGYNWLRDRVFTPLGNFFTRTIPGWASTMSSRVKGFFRSMRDGIGTIWTGIQNKTKAPVNWVIDHVWNNGIRSVWGKIAGWVGIKNTLGKIKLLASGGTVGNEPLGVFNRPTAIVGEGRRAHPEYVIPTDPQYRSRALALWQAAGTHFMKDGGILGSLGSWIGSAASTVGSVAKGAADFFTDPAGIAKKLLNGALKGLSSIEGSEWGRAIARLPHMAVDGLLRAVKKAGGSLLGAAGLGSSGGSGVKRWSTVVQAMLRQVGQPPGLLGITLKRMNQESGGNPTIVNKWDSNWQAGHPSVGLMQVIRGTFQRYAGPYRNTGPFLYGVSTNPAANIYASMKYALAAYGSLASAYGRAGGYRLGTMGATAGWHWLGEDGPELAKLPAGTRIRSARSSARQAAGPVVVHLTVENHGVIGSRQEVENWLVGSLETLRVKRRLPRALGGTA